MPETTTRPRKKRKAKQPYQQPAWLTSLLRVHTVPFFDGDIEELPRAKDITDDNDPGLLWDGADEDDPEDLASPPALRNHLLYLQVRALGDIHRQNAETIALLRANQLLLVKLVALGQPIPEQLDEMLDIFTDLAAGNQTDDDDGDLDDGDDSDLDDGDDGDLDGDSDEESSTSSTADGDESEAAGGGGSTVTHQADEHFPDHPVAVTSDEGDDSDGE